MKKIPFVFFILMILLSVPGAAGGEDSAGHTQELPEVLQKIAAQLQDLEKDAFGFRPGYILTPKSPEDGNGFPVSFDLRKVDTDGDGIPDVSYVTPVKEQNPFGTCWGFAAIAASETSILSSGLADDLQLAAAADPDKELEELNLSEKHVSFFANRPVMLEGNPQYGEGLYNDYVQEGSSDIYNLGGMLFYATGIFASGTGPLLESSDEMLEYHGREKKILYAKIGGETIPYCYHPDDDWYLTPDNDWRWRQHFVLKESFILPSPALAETAEEKEAANRAIKEQLLAGRSVEIAFTADTSMPNQERTSNFINLENWAHYTYSNQYINHAVLIIGWDDRYPKENFAHKIKIGEDLADAPIPEKDGAWLVKNSWGSMEGEFPNKGLPGRGWGLLQGQDQCSYNETTGKCEYKAIENAVNTGYFWISYEDKTIELPEALSYDHAMTMNGYWMEQHDFMPVQTVSAAVSEVSDGEIKMANIFAAEEDSQLEYVSCQTTYPGTKVLYQVYRLEDPSGDPVQGEPAAQAYAEYPWGGFHKIRLENPPLFKKGEKFSVVVTQTTSDGMYAFSEQLYINKNYCTAIGYDDCTYARGIINPGESLIYLGDTWIDQSVFRDDYLEIMYGELAPMLELDNFPIKAWLGMLDPEYTPPQAKQLLYTGELQELVEPGKVTGTGTMYYALGTAETWTERFTPSIPSAAEPGTYYVWYFVYGEQVRKSTDPQCIAVTITGASRELENLLAGIEPSDPALYSFLQDLLGRASAVDYSQYGKTPGVKAHALQEACRKAREADPGDPAAVLKAAKDLAEAYDAVMKILLTDGAEDPPYPERPDVLEFFRLEGELPATGISGTAPLSGKAAALHYRPLDMELQIPSLDLRSEIVALTPEEGQYPVEGLGMQTGWLEGSAAPGEGISVLAAHNTLNAEEYGPFALIGTLQAGDRFSLLRKDGSLIMFEVYANVKIGGNDRKSLEDTAAAFENTLTLLTCEDERAEGGYASRRIVSARMLEDR